MQELTFGYMFCDSAYLSYYNEMVETCTRVCVSSCSATQSGTSRRKMCFFFGSSAVFDLCSSEQLDGATVRSVLLSPRGPQLG